MVNFAQALSWLTVTSSDVLIAIKVLNAILNYCYMKYV